MYITTGLSCWGLPALFMRVPIVSVTCVIVGVDGSAGSAAALRWAADEAWRRQVGLRIVSVWQETSRTRLTRTADPARVAASRVKDALGHVLSRHDYSHRITCATAHGGPGEILVSEAGEAGLLVLGAAGNDIAQALGPTGRFCLRRGRGPLVFVPADRAI
jgi:nucleotide-binding universal stress UspA family protein